MTADLIVGREDWHELLGITRTAPTRIDVRILNAVPNMSTTNKGLHRWLHRNDLLALLDKEAERLESRDLRLLAARIRESTAPKGGR